MKMKKVRKGGTQMTSSKRLGVILGAALALACLGSMPATADVAGVIVTDFPETLTVGGPSVIGSLTIINTSTTPNDTDSITVGAIVVTPSCASPAPGGSP